MKKNGQTYARVGTRVFAGLLVFSTVGFCVWSLAGSQQTVDRLVGGVVMSSILFFVYRCALWPRVVVSGDRVVVHNPIVTYKIMGACEILLSNGKSPILRVVRHSVPIYEFSSSILAEISGNRELHRLMAAVNDRHRLSRLPAEPVMSRDRRTIVRQYLGVQSVMAVLVLLAGLRH